MVADHRERLDDSRLYQVWDAETMARLFQNFNNRGPHSSQCLTVYVSAATNFDDDRRTPRRPAT